LSESSKNSGTTLSENWPTTIAAPSLTYSF